MRKFDDTYFADLGKIEFPFNLELYRKGQINFHTIKQFAILLGKYKQYSGACSVGPC